MKKTIFVIILSLFVNAEEKPKCTNTLSETVLSKYYGSIIGGIFYDAPLVFSELNINCSGTYVDLWASRPITNRKYNQNGGDEYDLTIGKSFQINRLMRGDVGGTYLAVYPLSHGNGHIYTLQGRLDFNTKVVQPYVQYFHFGKTGRTSPPSGEFFYAGIQRNQ